MTRPRWNLKHLAIAIAVLALAFAVMGVEGTVVALVVVSPAILAAPGRRVAALYWVSVFYPWLGVLSLYLTWVTARFALGHWPRPSLDDPKDISAIRIPYAVTDLLGRGLAAAFIAALLLTALRVGQRFHQNWGRSRWWANVRYSLLIMGMFPFLWFAAYLTILWDPLHVLFWYFD